MNFNDILNNIFFNIKANKELGQNYLVNYEIAKKWYRYYV